MKNLPSAVGVVNLLSSNGVDWELLDLVSNNSDSGVGALGEHNSTNPLRVLLGKRNDGLGNLLHILGGKVVRLSVGGGLGLVANEDFDVGEDLVELVLEELGDERSRQVENERL